jgi:fucose 4-O-acetylase-like acetyltransferase
MNMHDNSRGVSNDARNLPLGYLRTFLTLLVVAHHAALAYHPYAPPPPSSPAALAAEPMMWLAFPVVDSHRAPGLDLLVGWNDTFFMSLMFLVSGLFVWSSLQRKGAAGFFRERARRLGLPFLAAALLLAPLAYYPTYLAAAAVGGHGAGGASGAIEASAGPGPAAFLRLFLSLGVWPAGPAWFLWVLLAFGGLAAAAFKLWPAWGTALGRLTGRLSSRPIAWFGALLAASALAYLPMAAFFHPETWSHFGPFWVQTSRLLHYAVYFFAGAGLGAAALQRHAPPDRNVPLDRANRAGLADRVDRTDGAGLADRVDRTDCTDGAGLADRADREMGSLLAPGGKLARRWPLWACAALAAFGLAIAAVLVILQTLPKGGPGPLVGTFGNFTFVLACACTSLACLAIFLRFVRRAHRLTDSLSANAYGIYILHYFCVTWLQLALLHAGLPGAVKWLAVFAGAVALSWSLSALLRRLPALARVL